jgi:hypothetical protein
MAASAVGSFNCSTGEQTAISVKLPIHWVVDGFALMFGFHLKLLIIS